MRAVHWFRNDLRLGDNTALAAACARAEELVPLFVVDPRLFGADRHSDRTPAKRLNFLLESLAELAGALERAGCPLIVRVGDPVVEVARVVDETRVDLLTFNRDTSPYARRRDLAVAAAVRRRGAAVDDRKDRVVFESDEVRTKSGGPFQVYTPYLRAWRAELHRRPLEAASRPRLPRPLAGLVSQPLPPRIPVDGEPIAKRGASAARRRLGWFAGESIDRYAERRDLPAVDGTSLLSPHLRLGTVSIRDCVRAAEEAQRRLGTDADGPRKWLDELVWREFYAALLAEHPRLLGGAFRREYDEVRWNDDETGFEAWCDGRTGYPIVDAAMRQLVHTGWMHNRARMIAASFLVKDLLIDWRRGEEFFLRLLVDGDPASNNGGWQWAASTGTDAQPYFRIFNPVAQGERVDAEGIYVRRFVPELRGVPDRFVHRPWQAPAPPADYPPPIVDHAERRIAAVARFEAARRG
jgi:deoxyribodipyrimidine photo-lyase